MLYLETSEQRVHNVDEAASCWTTNDSAKGIGIETLTGRRITDMPRRLVFVSSVQKELQQERYEIRDYVNGDPLLNKHFTVFLFEDLPPNDRRPDEVYLDMVMKSDNYVGLFGSKYGKPNADGFSPVEQEYLCAREHAKH